MMMMMTMMMMTCIHVDHVVIVRQTMMQFASLTLSSPVVSNGYT